MKHPLRDYQKSCTHAVVREWESVPSTLVCKPVGTGKTVTFAALIEIMRPRRAMVIAHTRELIWQAKDKIERFTGLDCEIEMADSYANNSLFHDTPVVISTVQTQNSKFGQRTRMSRFKPDDFGLLIVDECHHSTAQSYRNVINYYRQNPELRVCGFTATPDRADEEALGQIFDTVAFDYEILDAIHDGWLVPVEQQFVRVAGLDYSHIRTTAGDLNNSDLAAVMEAEENLQGVAGASIEIIGRKRAIVFTSSVAHAEAMHNIYNRHRCGMSGWVCGETNKEVRRQMLDRFARGEIQVVVNCGVLTEGFDDPGVEVIIMARPTKSRSLYAQMAGRSIRPLPGIVDHPPNAEERRSAIATSAKPSCLIVDFVGNSGRHKLMSSADILGGKVSDSAISRAKAWAEKLGKAVKMAELLDNAEEEIRQEMLKKRQQEEARKARLVAKVKYSSQKVDAFDLFDRMPTKERGWDEGKTLSEKQRNLLRQQGVDPDKLSYSAARAMVIEICRRFDKKLCSVKQAAVLNRYGYDTNSMTREQASRTLDELARNGWKRGVHGQRSTPEPILPKHPSIDEPSPFDE